MPEIRLPCFGAKSSEFWAVECHQILVLRMFVGECFQHFRTIIVAVLGVLIAKQGDSLQFVFCSHVCFQCLLLIERKNNSSLMFFRFGLQRYIKNPIYASVHRTFVVKVGKSTIKSAHDFE